MTDTDTQHALTKTTERDDLLRAAGGYLAVVALQYAAGVAAKDDPAALYRALAAQQKAFVAATQAQLRAAQIAVHIAAEQESIGKPEDTA